MIDTKADFSLDEVGLVVSISVSNISDVDLYVAARAPFGLNDHGTLYVSGTDQPGLLHLMVADTFVPEHIFPYEAPVAFYRLLAPDGAMTETYRLPNPLFENAPYQEFNPDLEDPGILHPVTDIRLSVGICPAAAVYGDPRPVEGSPDLVQVWGESDPVINQWPAPEGLMLGAREDQFFRF